MRGGPAGAAGRLSDGRGAADGPNERGKPDENGETGNQGDPAPAPGRPAANPLRFVTSDERLGLALLGFVTGAFRPTAEGIKGGLSMKPLTPDRATDRAVTVAYLTLRRGRAGRQRGPAAVLRRSRGDPVGRHEADPEPHAPGPAGQADRAAGLTSLAGGPVTPPGFRARGFLRSSDLTPRALPLTPLPSLLPNRSAICPR